MDDARADVVARLTQINEHFAAKIPLHVDLGLTIVELGDGRARMRLPYGEALVGDPDTGLLHGGAVSILVDAACGAAVFQALHAPTNVATLDLRVDHLKPAPAGRDLHAEARCLKMTRSVAFVRALAWYDTIDDPIAVATATFMVGTHVSKPRAAQARS